MKKFMIFSLLAALACGAWADETYATYNVNVVDVDGKLGEYKHLDGKIPTTVTLNLVDTGWNDNLIYSQKFSFLEMMVATEHIGEFTLGGSKFVEDGRLNIAQLVSEGGRTLGSLGDATFTFDQVDTDGWGLTVSVDDSVLMEKVYEGAKAQGYLPMEYAGYAKDNLETHIFVDGRDEPLILGIDTAGDPTNLKSIRALGAMVPAPEPTSGLLLLMGLAGLALKRKQQAK